MASTIQIKRGTTDAVAGGGGTGISLGEPLWHYDTSNGRYKLYVGKGATAGDIVWVGAEISNSTSKSGQSEYRLMTESAIHDLVESEDTLTELNDTNITSPADGTLLLYDTGTSTWRDGAMSGDATIGDTGTLTIANDAISLAKMASGTDGNIISYDTSGNPVAVATGNDGQVLTSAGSGNPPVFETPTSAAISTYSNASNNRLITSVDSTSVNSEANLTFDGSALTMTGTMFIKEQAEAASDAADYGQLWINTATPNELYFTDDAGTDHRIQANTNTQLSTEQVQDIVGGMVAGNTETRIAVTYQDGDGTLDFVVTDMNDTVNDATITLAAGAGLTGAGDFTTNQSGNETLTFTVGAGTGVTVNANDIAIGQSVATNAAVTFATVDTGQGANELYDMNQNVKTDSAVTFATVDTGQGANELYDMNQNVKTDSDVIFAAGTFTNLTVNGTTTTIATTNLTVTDPLVKYGQGYTGSAYDQGFVVTRGDGSSSNTQNMAFIWDESADEFASIKAATEAGTTAGDVTVTDYVNLHVGTLKADDGVTIGGTAIAGATTEQIQDIVGAMVAGNTETNITVTYQDGDGTLDFVGVDTQPLTTEQVQDIVGAMLVGTETRIAVSYDDTNGEIDFVVDDMTTNTQYTAGNLLDLSGTEFAVDLQEATETAAVVADDYFLFLDGGASGATKKESLADYAALIAGTNITASNGVLSGTAGPLTTEQVQDICGAMFSSNTETRCTVTYQDGDGTIDVVVDDLDTNTEYTAGEGIDISGSYVISGENATTSNKGIASFSSTNFSVSSGAVSISAVDGGTY